MNKGPAAKLSTSFPSHHNDARLIVGQHDRNETSVGMHRSHDVVHVYTSCRFRHGHKGYLCDRRRKAALSEFLQDNNKMFVKI